MKRPLWIIAAIAALVAAGFAFQQVANTPRELASLIPPGPLLYLEAKDFHSLLREWNSSGTKAAWLKSANYEVFSRSRLLQRLELSQGIRRRSWSAAGYESTGERRGGSIGARALRHWQSGVSLCDENASRPVCRHATLEIAGHISTAPIRGHQLLRENRRGYAQQRGLCSGTGLRFSGDARRRAGRSAGFAGGPEHGIR